MCCPQLGPELNQVASYLLAGVSGAVAAGAPAVLALRMRAPLRVGVAGGVAVTGAAAPALRVDVGRRRPWQWRVVTETESEFREWRGEINWSARKIEYFNLHWGDLEERILLTKLLSGKFCVFCFIRGNNFNEIENKFDFWRGVWTLPEWMSGVLFSGDGFMRALGHLEVVTRFGNRNHGRRHVPEDVIGWYQPASWGQFDQSVADAINSH